MHLTHINERALTPRALAGLHERSLTPRALVYVCQVPAYSARNGEVIIMMKSAKLTSMFRATDLSHGLFLTQIVLIYILLTQICLKYIFP